MPAHISKLSLSRQSTLYENFTHAQALAGRKRHKMHCFFFVLCSSAKKWTNCAIVPMRPLRPSHALFPWQLKWRPWWNEAPGIFQECLSYWPSSYPGCQGFFFPLPWSIRYQATSSHDGWEPHFHDLELWTQLVIGFRSQCLSFPSDNDLTPIFTGWTPIVL